MRHGVRLTVAYDGTAFAGFQAQVGQRTVQGALNEAAERICRHPVRMRGASRTDAGVHAQGQVVGFDSERELPPERWVLALNRYLAPDVSVRRAEPCDAGYDPRFDAKHKTYRYLFHVGAARDALLHDRVWQLGRYVRRGSLQLAAMRESCVRLTGTHDFRAFRAAADQRPSTVRTLQRVELIEHFADNPELLALEVQGNAFMMNMVRILAGTLIEVGRARLTPAQVTALLSTQGERARAGATAPACGLTLVEVTLGRLREQASPPDP